MQFRKYRHTEFTIARPLRPTDFKDFDIKEGGHFKIGDFLERSVAGCWPIEKDFFAPNYHQITVTDSDGWACYEKVCICEAAQMSEAFTAEPPYKNSDPRWVPAPSNSDGLFTLRSRYSGDAGDYLILYNGAAWAERHENFEAAYTLIGKQGEGRGVSKASLYIDYQVRVEGYCEEEYEEDVDPTELRRGWRPVPSVPAVPLPWQMGLPHPRRTHKEEQ